MRGSPSKEEFADSKADVWSWNVNGVNSVIDKGIIAQFIAKNDPTILCLNETKTDVDKLDKKMLYSKIGPGYAQYWNCCKRKKGYSGTAIFTKVRPISVQFDFGQKHVEEGRSITMEFQKFVLVATYVPNAGDGLKRLDYRINEWDAEFHAYLKRLEQEKGKPVLLGGDLNVAHNEIDIYDPKGKEKVPGYTPQERQSFTELLSKGFRDTYRDLYPVRVQYTFWSVRQNLRPSNRGWRLDYFLLSKDHETKYGIELVDSIIDEQQMGSDHCPIAIRMLLPSDDGYKTALDYTSKPLRNIADVADEEVKGVSSSAEDDLKEQFGISMKELPRLGTLDNKPTLMGVFA